MTIIEEIYKRIADAMGLPVWEIASAVDMNDINQQADASKYPCLAYLFNQPFVLSSDYPTTGIYSEYNTQVWLLGKPSDERAESLLACKKELTTLAVQFRQIMQKQEEFSTVQGNNTFNPSISFAYPQFDAKLVACSVSFTAKFDMTLTVCTP